MVTIVIVAIGNIASYHLPNHHDNPSATLNVYGAIPLFIGIAVGSPILAIGMWVGSFLGIGSAWCIGIDPDDMFNGAYGTLCYAFHGYYSYHSYHN